jgi:endonuclease/exonuclease/phosphatase family metal-dependent hydrolase
MAAFAVVSYNIRHAVLDDGEHAWANRREAVFELLDALDPDVLGLQESTGDQHEEVAAGLPGYEWAGVADDPGSGEHNPIGVGDRFALAGAESTWLSESREEGSVGWDGSFARVATRVELRDRETDRDLAVINTHFDHKGPTARAESARLLREQVDALDAEAVVLGDFNSKPDSEPYGILAGDGYERGLTDARDRAATVEGPGTTITDFEALDPDRELDHVFVTDGLAVDAYRVVDRTADGRYPSDHLPLVAEMRFD